MSASTRRTAAIVLAGTALASAAWVRSLATDPLSLQRPAYGAFTWPGQGRDGSSNAPRGGPEPTATGWVRGSAGHDFFLPPMPPARHTDIARADNAADAVAIRSCFFPGPRLRPGYYTTDPDDYGIENQLPDIGNTFATAWLRLPDGARLVLRGEFPRLRHWSFVTYTDAGVPRDALNDVDIEPDPGSSNPFRPGVRRDVAARGYTLVIANGQPPAPRPANTLYTMGEPGDAIGMHMRNYVPDRGLDWTGGVGLPRVELHLADGRVLAGDDACRATDAPLRGRQAPITVSRRLWLALNRLPWRPADRTPARDFEVAAMERFFNREHLMLRTFFPLLPSDFLAVEKGGFWSNPVTRYGYTYLSQAYGSVYVVRGRMPTTPSTWDADGAPMRDDTDMRYWSVCTVTSPASGNTVDCVHDENVRPLLDAGGNFTVVVSRATNRPANASERCGVAWIEYGNGDGLPGGSPDFGAVINRHTLVNASFAQSWFAVERPGQERDRLGERLPHVINLHDRAHFESLGCPVDTDALQRRIDDTAPR